MKPKWYFYPAWIIMNTLITPISWGISWVLISQIVKMVGGTIQVAGQTRITEDFLGFYVLIPILGLLTGLLQYLLLRIYLPRPRWWIAATLLGWLLVLGVLRLTTTLPLPAYSLDTAGVVLGAALVGLAIGLPQWWMLRARVGHAAWWLLTLAISWGLLGFLNGHTITNPWFFSFWDRSRPPPLRRPAGYCWIGSRRKTKRREYYHLNSNQDPCCLCRCIIACKASYVDYLYPTCHAIGKIRNP